MANNTYKVGLIQTTSRRSDELRTVKRKYWKSPLFRYSLSYSEKHYDLTLVLSGERLVLRLNDEVDNEFLGINWVVRKEFKNWLNATSDRIKKLVPAEAELFFLTGKRPNKLIKFLPEFVCHEPVKGLGLGDQLKFYKSDLGQILLLPNKFQSKGKND